MCIFISKLFYALSNLDLNIIGLIFGFSGGILIIFFGLPSISVLNSGSYVGIEITPKIRLYNWLSRIGLIFFMVGFFPQLISAVNAITLR